MSKANKGAWRSSATGIAFCQQSVFVSGRRRRRRCCCVFWVFLSALVSRHLHARKIS